MSVYLRRRLQPCVMTVLILCMAIAGICAAEETPDHSKKPAPVIAPRAQAPVPAVSATLQGQVGTDNNGNGKVDPGDTIRFSSTIKNTGTGDAQNVNISIPLDPNLKLVPGSVKTTPVAVNDTYAAVQDTALPVAAPGVLANDFGLPAPTVTPITNGPTTLGGTVTLNADGSFTYTPPAGVISPPADTFTYSITNGNGTDMATVTITINDRNDPPSFTKGNDQTVAEDAGPQLVAGWATAISPGPANEAGQTVSFVVTNNTNPGLFSAGPAVASNGDLSFKPAPDANGTARITLVAKDDGGTAFGGVDTSAPQTFTITVTPVNDAPVLAAIETTPLAYTENDVATPITSSITVNDVDNTTLASATIQIYGNFRKGEDSLVFTSNPATMGNIVGSPITNTLTLTSAGATATLAQWQAALRAVQYVNSSDNPDSAARTVSFVVNDGALDSDTLSRNITITPVNDAPVLANAGPTSILFTEGDAAAAIAPQITANDSDDDALASGTVSITTNFNQNEDVLSLINNPATMGNISGAFTKSTGVLALSSAGNTADLAEWQAALAAVSYQNTSQNPSAAARTVTFQVDDGHSTNHLSNILAISVTVSPVNNPPVLANIEGTPLNYTENDAATPITATITVADPDNTTLASGKVQITGNFTPAEDVLAFTSVPATMGNIAGNYSAGTLTLTSGGATATLAQWQAALQAVTYFNSSENPSEINRTISFSVNDGALNSSILTRVIAVSAVNDAPVLAAIEAGTLAYTEKNPAVTITNTITVNDVDNITLPSGTVSITNGFAGAEDVLGFINNPGTMGNIAGSYSAGVLTLTSLNATATLAQWQAALRAVTYVDTSANPSTATRTVSFTVTDGDAVSNTLTRNISVTAVNDAPVLANIESSTLGYVAQSGAKVITATTTVSDVDNTTLASATVQITGNYVSTEDVLAVTGLPGGLTSNYNSTTGLLTITGSATVAQYQSAIQSVTYTNTATSPNSAVRTVSFTVNDGSANSNIVTRNISFNQAPVLSNIEGTTLNVNENVPLAITSAITINDPDNATLASGTVSITTNFQAGEDVLIFNGTGATGNITGSFNAGTLTLTSAGATATLAQWQAALQAVQFNDTSDAPNTSNRTVVFQVSDGTSLSNTQSRTVTVTPVNDAPVLASIEGTALGYTENDAATAISNSITVSDPDNATLSIGTVVITAGFVSAQDTLALISVPATMGNITGVYAPATGTLSLTSAGATATLAQWQTALRAVTYVNGSDNPTGNRTVTFAVNDGTLNSNSVTRNITITAVNDAPVLAAIETTPLSATEQMAIPITATMTVSDADNTTLASGTVAITANFQAGEDVLSFSNNPATMGNIAGTFSAGTLTLTSAGATATLAQWQTALRAVMYTDNSDTPNTALTRTVAFTVNDGALNSNTQTRNITVTAVNDAPVVTAPGPYGVTANIRISISAPGLLTTVTDVDGVAPFTVAQATYTTANSGTVTVNQTTGAFTYDPPAGYTGSDSFQYTVTDSGTPPATSAPVTVNFTVNGPIVWYANSSAPAGGNGTLQTPFNTLAAAHAAASPTGGTVFMFSGNYTGGITLSPFERIFGQGANGINFDTVVYGGPAAGNSIARPTIPGAPPVITTTAASTNGITLSNNNNTFDGFTIDNTTGAKIASPAGFGTLNVSDVTLSGAGQALNLNGGNLAATFISITTTSSPTQGIVFSSVGGTMTVSNGTTISGQSAQGILITGSGIIANFNNTVITGGTNGVSLQNNAAGTRTFGTLTINNTTGTTNPAFLHANGGGTTTVGLTTINKPAGTGIDIQDSTTLVQFAGTTIDKSTTTGIGVNLGNATTGNTGGVAFGSLGITTSSGSAFVSSRQAGAITVSSGTQNINATNGAALDIRGIAPITPLSMTLGTVSSSSSTTSGINLMNISGTMTATGGSLTGSANTVFNLVSSTPTTVSYSGTMTQTTGNVQLINVQGVTSGTVTFSGALTSTTTTGVGIAVTGSTGGTVNFSNTSGSSVITSGSGGPFTSDSGTVNFTGNNYVFSTSNSVCFNSTGGTLSATGTGNTLTSSGTALSLVNATIGASGLTFQSITTTGSGSNPGITLDGTGSSGGLSVTGTGTTAGSGGTISNKSAPDILGGSDANGNNISGAPQGIGIFMRNTSNPSFQNMQLNDCSNCAIYGKNVTGFSLTHSVVSGVNGSNSAGDREEPAIRFDNLLTSATFPTALIDTCSISGGYYGSIGIWNTSGSLNRLTISNSTLGTISTVGGNDNVEATAYNNATMNISVLTNTFNGTRNSFIQAIGNNNSIVDCVARNNTFKNGQAIIPGGGTGVSVRGDSAGSSTTMTFDISDNLLNGAQANAFDTVGIFVAKGNGGGTMVGTIQGNVIGPAQSNANADGIFVRSYGTGTLTTLILNNNITGYGNNGIHLQNNDGGVVMNASLFGNVETSPNSNNITGLFVDNGATAGPPVADTSTTNIVIGDSTTSAKKNTFASFAGGTDVSLSNFSSTNVTKLNLSKAGSASATVTGVVQGDNNGTASVDEAVGLGAVTLVTTFPSLPPPVAPLSFMPSGVRSTAVATQASLTQTQLDRVASVAKANWNKTGLSNAQCATLGALKFEVATLSGGRLGEATQNVIRIDASAGGNGWFTDATASSDKHFPMVGSKSRRTATLLNASAGRIDLLTALEHEMGHALGLPDTYRSEDRDSIMYGWLTTGERRSLAQDQALNATLRHDGPAQPLQVAPESQRTGWALEIAGLFAVLLIAVRSKRKSASKGKMIMNRAGMVLVVAIVFSTVTLAAQAADSVSLNLPALPAGKQIVVMFDTTVAQPVTAGTSSVSTQGAITATGITPVLTDDPNTAALNDTTIIAIGNTPPALNSALTAAPNPGIAGRPVQFGAGASDADLDTLSYLWNFNDGTTSTVQNPAHTFATPGTYAVTLTVSDGRGGSAMGSISVDIRTGVLGEGDADNDGFPDEVEAALGSDPFSPGSRPLGLPTIAASTPFTFGSLAIKLDFAHANADTIRLNGHISINGIQPVNQIIIVDVGGVVKSFVLNAGGHSMAGTSKVALKVGAVRIALPPNRLNFTLALTKGSFAAAFADEGLTSAPALKTPKTVNVTVIFLNIVFKGSISQLYTVKKTVGTTTTPK